MNITENIIFSFSKLLSRIRTTKVDPSFLNLFLRKENQILIGKKGINFWILCLLLMLTFLAMGLANGGLDYLKFKMSDPFINWVNVNIPFDKREDFALKIEQLKSNDTLKSEYDYNQITGYNQMALIFRDVSLEKNFQSIGRTIDIESPLLKEIIEGEHWTTGKGFASYEDLGLIVTESFIRKYGLSHQSAFVNMEIALSGKDVVVPVPIVGIVEDLPGLNTFLCTSYFHYLRFYAPEGNPFAPEHTSGLNLYAQGTYENCEQLKVDLLPILKELSISMDLGEPNVDVVIYQESHVEGHYLNINFEDDPDPVLMDSLYHQLIANNTNAESLMNKMIRIFQPKFYNYNTYKYPDKLSIHFNSLEKIPVFSQKLSKSYGIQVDMTQIEMKKNFAFISKLTLIIAFCLIGFSILSIAFYLNNILDKHLNNIKSNLGTVKAFGLDNQTLKKIYQLIVISFIVLSTILSYGLIYIFGETGLVKKALYLAGFELEDGHTYFNLLSNTTLIAILLFILITYSFAVRTIKKILNNSPGNLIYGRS